MGGACAPPFSSVNRNKGGVNIKTVSAYGIYYDLSISPYTYEENNLKFYFSSKLYLKKFIGRKDAYIYNLMLKIRKIICIDVQVNEIGLICLYNEIESRGWLVELRGERVCRRQLKYAGNIMRNSY